MDGLDLLALIADTIPPLQMNGGDGDAPDTPDAEVNSNPTAELPFSPHLGSSYVLSNYATTPIEPNSAPNPLTALGSLAGVSGATPGPNLPTPAQYGRTRTGGSGMRVRVPATPRTRKPAAVRGNSGIDLGSLNLGELLFLVLFPQGPQIISMMSQAQQQKRQEAIQQQQMMLEQQQMQRANEMQDLNTRLLMNQQGAIEVPEGVTGDLQAAFSGGQKAVDTPAGRFVLPTIQKQNERALAAYQVQEDAKAISAARAAAVKEAAKTRNEPKVPLAPEFVQLFRLGWTRELPKSVVDSMVHEYNARKPPSGQMRVVSNNDGTLTVVHLSPQGTTTETVPGGPKRAAGTEGLTANQARIADRQAYQDEKKRWDDAKDAHDKAQALIDKARSLDRTKRPPGDPTADPDWQAAREAAQSAARAHPDYVHYDEKGGYPNVGLLKPQPTPSTFKTTGAAVPVPTGKAGGPGLTQSQQERDFALQKYKAMTPEQKQQKAANGQTYREWFIARYGLDPDTL